MENKTELLEKMINSGIPFDEILMEALKEFGLEAYEMMLIAEKVGKENTDVNEGAKQFIKEVIAFSESKAQFKKDTHK